MHLIGRYERVRALGPSGWGLPYILDRKRAELCPAAGSEWWRSPEGIWLPIPSGGVGLSGGYDAITPVVGVVDAEALTVSNWSLNSAYTAGSAGAGVATRFVVPQAETLNNWYFHLVSFGGTAANVNDINLELRADSSGSPNTSGGGLLESKTYDPSSTTGWHNVSGWTTALTAGTTYWVIVADADGNGTDFARVGYVFNLDSLLSSAGMWMTTFSSNGYISSSKFQNRAMSVGVFASGRVAGRPFSNHSQLNSNVQRGLYIDGLTSDLKVAGLWFDLGNANLSQINVWEGATGPSGTPLKSSTSFFRNTSGNFSGGIFTDFVTLSASTLYRVVLDFSVSTTGLRKLQIGAGADANLRKAMPGQGGWKWTEEIAGPAWSEDADGFPLIGLLVEDYLGGGGGGGGVSKSRIIGGI